MVATGSYGDYGEERALIPVKLIAAANLIGDPDHITVGQVVYFPSFELGG